MSESSTPPPVRHGSARLELIIDGTYYRLSPQKPATRGVRGWNLQVLSGKRIGTRYYTCSVKGVIACSCPDMGHNKAACKHSRALQALGLLPKGALPGPLAEAKALGSLSAAQVRRLLVSPELAAVAVEQIGHPE